MTQTILDDLHKLDLQIYRSIEAHPGLSTLEDIEFFTSERHIRLRGRVASYFEKQLAQETIRSLDQEREIENDLTVAWS